MSCAHGCVLSGPALAAFAAGVAVGAAAAAVAWRLREKRKARMLSFISHELNTPITAVNMTVLNFVSGVFGPLAKEHSDWMLMVKEQMTRLNGLVGELRDFIHLELHQDLRLQTEPVDAVALVRDAVGGLEGLVTRTGAKVELALPEGPLKVLADPDRFARGVGALVAHARKFRSKGSVRVALAAVSGGAEVCVEYDGPKSGAEAASRMLELYFPVSRAAGSQLLCAVGTGLGVVREITEMQGGQVALTVDPEGRTRLRLWLPGG